MNDKVSAFVRLVQFVEDKFLWVITTLLLIFITLAVNLGYRALERNMDQIIETMFPAHDFQLNLKIDGQVQTALSTLREEIDADRLAVAQYHNGVRGDGLPAQLGFRSYSARYAEAAPGIAFNFDDFQSIPLGIIAEINEVLWEGGKMGCGKWDINDLRLNVLKHRLASRGTDVIYSCGIAALDGHPIGMITAAYMDRTDPRPSDEEILKLLEDAAVRISGYLQYKS